MANSNKKLTDLPAVSSVSGTTIFLVDDSSTTQTANGTVVKNYIYNSFFSSTLTLSIDINTTGNITSGNASLGNLTTSGYFSGNGSLLTHIAGANVSGFVPNANVANTAYAVAGANVSGFVPNANIANTSYSVTGGNVSGQVSNALVAGTVYTAAQPNITSVGNLTSLIVLTDGVQGPSGGGLVQTQTDTNTPMGSGNRIAGYFFGGATSTSHTIVNSVSLEAFATQNWTAGAHGSKLIIATTANGASSRTTAITINQDQTSNFANTVTVTGNVSANFILGDGSQLSNISNIANLTQTNGNFTMTGNFLPSLSNTYTLGSPTNKWSDIFIGPNSIHLQDTANSQLDATMTITNGVLLINGANQLQVGQLKFVNNTIESTTGNIDIEIGSTSASANLRLNRNTVVDSSKTLYTGDIVATGNLIVSTNVNLPDAIDVNGTIYDSSLIVSDIGNAHIAQTLLTRFSTEIPPIIAGAMNNSDDPLVNGDVAYGQPLFQVGALGFAGNNYKVFASIVFGAEDNNLLYTISDTSAPGKIDFFTTPDGSVNGTAALTIHCDSSAEFYGNVTIDGYVAGDLGVYGNITVYDGNDNVVATITTDGNITYTGTLQLPTLGNNDGTANIVNYSGGVLKAGPQLKDYAGNIGANNITLTGLLKAPQTTKASNATGTVGQICWDSNYIYVCTATNTWKRSPLTGGY